ncbi:unnamed protein product [Trifolium pratense]|uniref:Uncharacterized protein n=1 Tax=Trifolium pratense TaxID=57577 RepID=A0ACB0K6X1_TRIPR|nr:unnamed protein product [Trifolium pratense]
MDAWKSQLQKLEKFPNKNIFDRFKSSYYDGLDPLEKDIFLDIACFYTGQLVYDVAHTLHSCGFYPVTGLNVLIDRGIISISEDRIVMHYLIQKMGQEIVRRQSGNDPGNRTRLWNPEDIYHVLINKWSNAIRCIFLDICKIYKVQLQADTFQMMNNLRILQFYKHFPQGNSNVILREAIENLSRTLTFLCWDGFPQKYLPPEFCPKHLVIIYMRESDLEKLWEGDDQDLPNLKRLDLSRSKKLIKVPDLSLSPNIEEVILSGCESLTEVSSSSFLSKLNCLCLNGCVQLNGVFRWGNFLR